ncbi:MAG: sigma-70 region 4 domain-containing protein [Ruminococcus flavefaciens]|nr:sigma-70 region 4 domain-containing protein [Ruminococcus flavefaciens]MCM1062130.1 sigma-70 region 4 domain-containing protein [Eubacterium sp.]
MTNIEKNVIISMNDKGMSVAEISEILKISKNTIKSYLQRKKTADVCLNCGAVLTHTPHKKRKKFCSDKCRMHYWNVHQNEMTHTNSVIIQCEVCGKDVLSYRKKPRRFCSRECAAKGRACHE